MEMKLIRGRVGALKLPLEVLNRFGSFSGSFSRATLQSEP
jgi:hypothetical protein